jgi:hypothetical protein
LVLQGLKRKRLRFTKLRSARFREGIARPTRERGGGRETNSTLQDVAAINYSGHARSV